MSYPVHVTRELQIQGSLHNGSRGTDVRKVQEWLTIHRFATSVDGDFGDATERAVRDFQHSRRLPVSGKVNASTWSALVEPLHKALQPVALGAGTSLSTAVLKVARQHLAQHPIEVGGQNRGPWVRVYMGGNQGEDWLWCAGFVTFLLRQASQLLGQPMPIPGSYSCDSLAYQAKERGLFVAGREVGNGLGWNHLGSAQIFLVRKTATDWTHTGLSFAGEGNVFRTMEGNSNGNGSRNGFEACSLTRSVAKKDFIRLAA